MKKFEVLIILVFIMISTVSSKLHASNDMTPDSIVYTSLEDKERANELTIRLEHIEAMDKASLTRSEKKVLRKEVRTINKELKSLAGGGVYLSVGALLLVVILLIILL
jgi:hypothetical protein